jgi:N12 class adenine-specific DNA methylase
MGKARAVIEAIRVLQAVEGDDRRPTEEERRTLQAFGGFGAVALHLFPDPVSNRYRSESWRALGEELSGLLAEAEYASARRTVFNAFYTSPAVVSAVFQTLEKLGVPGDALVLEPGCGSGNFLRLAPSGMRFVGVELDSVSGRIARALYPEHDVRVEDFQDSKLPEVDAVVGNPPFADVKLAFDGLKLSLHDYFFAKSLAALRPGGILALVTSRFTMDKQNGAVREYLAERADFLGAVRLPSDAFAREGTKVVTDVVFLRKRVTGQPPRADANRWLSVAPLDVEGAKVAVNRYFLDRPEMVLGRWSAKNKLYGGEEGLSVESTGDLKAALQAAVSRLPRFEASASLAPSPTHVEPVSFAPPPLEKHVVEGSFFIGEDQATILQIVEGRAEPVVYGGAKLKANGTMTGRRLAALVRLRDEARRVLQSQNEGWLLPHREEARRELNRVYDLFVSRYGLVNKTTFSESAKGTIVQRMPNLAKFIEDPDAMLVMALEECDPTTGTAVKAAIMLRDVVGKTPPVSSVESAEEGLLVSLDQKGEVDLGFISTLYGRSEEEVAGELGDLVYQDPATKRWETANEYLSGDVRVKLKVAERADARYARNADALRDVQPEDVLPGEIDANLGAPWIPTMDVRAFAAELFRVPLSSISIARLEKDAVWIVEAGYDAISGVAATSDYGTARANGIGLFELALNLKTPAIYDVVNHGDREERVLNQDETVAAREKQKRIKDSFRAWLFSDPERTERLVRTYNDVYNGVRLRVFDGSHLEFPGMSRAISLRPHQKDAVWRGMSGGNTLLAHVVGAGKTYTMVAIGMKRKAAGLSRKPLYVVPNHMLEQFAREARQLYPNARFLIATKDDLARDRRKIITAKIAGSEWDGVIVTHGSFERIGMSKAFQERFLREQIAEYDALLIDTARSSNRANRNLIKTIEKQKARREAKLKALLAEDKKDDGLVFDELGVDYLFIDEAHYFKNLETPTKMERVAGVQTGGSERAFDLYMKCRHLGELHEGRGVCFATGTPVSNSMVEMYTMQRFLDPNGLATRGIEHFDAWAATFGEVVDAMEIAPDGASLRPRSRFAKFVNLPELQRMFRSFADVQTADMLDLPRPRLAGGKPEIVSLPMSEEQQAIQKRLADRYEKIRSQKVDPREDNALAITTDGRKLALDPRLISGGLPEPPESKIDALVERVLDIWRKTDEAKGTQLVFCDLGVNPTPWGFSVYGEIVDRLLRGGVPRGQVAVVGDAESDAKKQALFERVRQGVVRVLVGSTWKMGTGANVQRRLAALHHLDAPWKPAEIEQREGRILRQGNENEEVSIFRYVTEGSFDAYMWQALQTKARFIGQVITGETAVRRAEDVGGQELSYAEVKAIASGNPAVLTLAEADAEIQKLLVLRKHHSDEQYLARKNARELPETLARLKTRLEEATADHETAKANRGAPVVVGGVECRPEEAFSALGEALKDVRWEVFETRRATLGRMRGFRFGIITRRAFSPEVFIEGEGTRVVPLSREARGPRAVLNALDRLFDGFDGSIGEIQRELALAEAKLKDYQARLDAPFPHERYVEELMMLRDELEASLSAPAQNGGEGPKARTPSELSDLILSLRESNKVEAAPPPRAAPRTERPARRGPKRRAMPEPAPPEGEDAADVQAPIPSPAPTASPGEVERPVVETPLKPNVGPKFLRPRPEFGPRKYQKWLF